MSRALGETPFITNLNQVLTRPHSALQNLDGDQHPNHAYLDGRSGGQIFYGSNRGSAQGSDGLRLAGTSDPNSPGPVYLDSPVKLWPTFPTTPAANTTYNLISFANSLTKSAVSNPMHWIDISPNIKLDTAGIITSVVRAGGTVTSSVKPSGVGYQLTIFKNDMFYKSVANSCPPFLPDTFADQCQMATTVGSAIENTWVPVTVLAQQIFSAYSGSTYILANTAGLNGAAVYYQPTFGADSLSMLGIIGGVAAVYVRAPQGGATPTGSLQVAQGRYAGMWLENLATGSAQLGRTHTLYSIGSTTTMIHAGPVRLGDTNDPASGMLLDIASLTQVSTAGLVSVYNADPTFGNGLCSVVANSFWTNQATTIAINTLCLPKATGLYQFRHYLACTSAGNNVNVSVNFYWQDEASSKNMFQPTAGGVAMNNLANWQSIVNSQNFPLCFRALSGTAITIATTCAAGSLGASRYMFQAVVERIA